MTAATAPGRELTSQVYAGPNQFDHLLPERCRAHRFGFSIANT